MLNSRSSASAARAGHRRGRRATTTANRLVEHRELRSHLAAVVEHSGDAIFTRRLDGRVVSWNAAATRIFGYRADEVIGVSSRRLLPRGQGDELRGLVARMRRGEVVRRFETTRQRKDGRLIEVSLTLAPVRDERRRLVGFSTIARDITGERRVRAALERSERELTELFEEAAIGLLFADSRGRILRVNPAMLGILRCRADEVVGQSLASFHPNRDEITGLLKRLANRETLHNFESVLRSREGRLREVLMDASACWMDGRVTQTRWFIRDITRRKQLEREVLAISERERRAFARELHDSLGQQLSGIAYLANVVRDRLQQGRSPEAAEVARLARLLKQAIRETRRLSRGLSPISPEPDGLELALRELAERTSEVYGVTCAARCPRLLPVLNSEAANNLYRIAQEAVNNALRHGRARRITITLQSGHRQACLCIADNGRGIRDLSPRRKGIGLRVMHYRAGLLRGTLTVRRRPRGGTEVRCVAPVSSLVKPVTP